jgi:hypothetical protein
MLKHMELLGFKVRDIVTGFEGVVSTIGFDLYGCVQGIVTPESKDGKMEESRWFDVKRLYKINNQPIMQVPSYSVVPGGTEKPEFTRNPIK